MKLLILYDPHSEHARGTETFKTDLTAIYPDIPVNMMDCNGPEGTAAAELYDVVQYPALLIVADDGQLVKDWEGDGFPSSGEVAGYFIR
jgi:hypothetical protein